MGRNDGRKHPVSSWDKLRFVYFPATAAVSLVSTLLDGCTVEVAAVGNEGLGRARVGLRSACTGTDEYDLAVAVYSDEEGNLLECLRRA